MRGWIAALFAVALLAWVPSVDAQDAEDFGDMEVRVGLDSMSLILRESVTGIDASEVRDDIDEDYGNADGQVTSDEIERFRADGLTLLSDQPECFQGTRFVLLDAQPPRRLSSIDQDVVGALGPVSSQTTLVQILQISFLFPNATGSSVGAEVNILRFGELGEAVGCVMMRAFGMEDYSSYRPNYAPTGPPAGCCDDAGPGLPGGLGLPVGGTAMRDDDQQGTGSADESVRFLIRPTPETSIDRDSIRPVDAQQYWDGSGIVVTAERDFNALAAQPVTFTVTGDAPSTLQGQATSPTGLALLGGAGAGLLALAAFAMTEYGRWLFIKWLLWWPGFSRLEKDEVLEHGRRSELYAYIKQNPGVSFTDLKEYTELANGTLVHHLRVLESQEFIRPIRDGFRTRFYMRGPRIQPEPYLSRTQKDLLDLIQANPGLTQKELARLAGLPRESVSYHARRLADNGKLEVKPDGKWRRYFLPAPPSGAGPTS